MKKIVCILTTTFCFAGSVFSVVPERASECFAIVKEVESVLVESRELAAGFCEMCEDSFAELCDEEFDDALKIAFRGDIDVAKDFVSDLTIRGGEDYRNPFTMYVGFWGMGHYKVDDECKKILEMMGRHDALIDAANNPAAPSIAIYETLISDAEIHRLNEEVTWLFDPLILATQLSRELRHRVHNFLEGVRLWLCQIDGMCNSECSCEECDGVSAAPGFYNTLDSLKIHAGRLASAIDRCGLVKSESHYGLRTKRSLPDYRSGKRAKR
ncbi:hypothetical protein HOD08_01030 [bacterium]|nr:hypothetical protein [bacterium]